MQHLFGFVAFVLACGAAAEGRADESVDLQALRWRHRVLLLPATEDSSGGAAWEAHSKDLLDRDLILFQERDDGYRQRFPKPQTSVVLQLPREMQKRAAGLVTLIGKDGGVKRQWNTERPALPSEVFRLVDSMPMRQREMRDARATGADLLGAKAKGWTAGPEWAHSKPLRLEDLRDRVVVVRFWTDTCPFCAKSLPAMQQLADELAGRPVTFVGLYQSKPRGSERPWRDAVARATRLGVRFPIAYDHDWQTLRSWWLDGGGRAATSASFVIAPDGTIVHVHPGPVFFPSDDPADARANADFEALRAAVHQHLPQAD